MAFPNTVLRNGEVYAWAGTRINIAGVEIVTMQSISYTDEETMEPIYGVGNKPIGLGRGAIAYQGSITLLADTVHQLQQASPSGRLQDLPMFALPVKFQAGRKVMTDVLRGVKFTTNQRSASQGDTSMPVELPLFIGQIDWAR